MLEVINGEDIIDDLSHYPGFDTPGSLRRFTVNMKTQAFFTSRGNLVVMCNLTYGIGSVALNFIKGVGVEVA